MEMFSRQLECRVLRLRETFQQEIKFSEASL